MFLKLMLNLYSRSNRSIQTVWTMSVIAVKARILGWTLMLLILPLLPLLLFMWPILLRWRKLSQGPPLHRPRQETVIAGEAILRLSHGDTRVQIKGVGHRTVVLVHGNVGSMLYLQELAQALADRGFRVVLFDLYGRGGSACGAWDHTLALFVSQLSEVLLALHTRDTHEPIAFPIDLVGYSVGSQIAAGFAATLPHLVRRLVCLCPAVRLPTWLAALLQVPPLRALAGRAARLRLQDQTLYAADWLHLHGVDDELQRKRSGARLAALHPAEASRFRSEPYIAHAFGSTLRCLPFDSERGASVWRRLATCENVEVHVVCGACDTTADGPSAAAWLGSQMGGGERALRSLRVLEGVGHSLPYETPELCCELLVELLSTTTAASD